MRIEPPPTDVQAAFGLTGTATRLDGGEGLAWLVDGAVLKPVIDTHETEWVHALLHRLEPDDGFHIAAPIPTTTGAWVHDGWAATRFLEGLRPAAPQWTAICDAGLRFGTAAEGVREWPP